MTTTVYRVQNAQGDGPYRPSSGKDMPTFSVGFSLVRHPTPEADWEALRVGKDANGWPKKGEWEAYDTLVRPYCFGFPTREAAVAWFGEESLRELRQQGYHLVEVQATFVSVSDSGKQCMFKPAAPLETYSRPKVYDERWRCSIG